MKTVKGDLIQLALDGKFDVFVHGCNCFCTMGAGIAESIKNQFPDTYVTDLNTVKGEKSKLGTYSSSNYTSSDNHDIIVINAYTQYHWKGNGNKVDYKAVESIFSQIKINFSGLRIGYPLIGAGLGGGDWQIISKIIESELTGEDHTLVIYKKT